MQATVVDSDRREREAPSLYEDVLAHEASRYAYLNTTKGVLYGDPDQDELKEVQQALEDAGIAYLFNAHEGRPRPTFYAHSMTGFGFDEIVCLITNLSPGR